MIAVVRRGSVVEQFVDDAKTARAESVLPQTSGGTAPPFFEDATRGIAISEFSDRLEHRCDSLSFAPDRLQDGWNRVTRIGEEPVVS